MVLEELLMEDLVELVDLVELGALVVEVEELVHQVEILQTME